MHRLLREQVITPLPIQGPLHDFYMPQALVDLTRELIPNCEVQRLDGIGHYLMVEDPEGTAAIITEFARASSLV